MGWGYSVYLGKTGNGDLCPTGGSVRWFAVSLVRWFDGFAGSLVRRFAGSLVRWFAGQEEARIGEEKQRQSCAIRAKPSPLSPKVLLPQQRYIYMSGITQLLLGTVWANGLL